MEQEYEGRVRFERRAYLLVANEGQRPFYDDYVISHRVRAARMLPELGFAIPQAGQPYPRSSWPAQLLALRISRTAAARLPSVEDALFGAMFRELRDISDPGVLRDCAKAAGLEAAEVDAALEDPSLRAQAEREHIEAEDLGVNGIPALVLPGLPPITGAVPVDTYRRALDHALG